jgi:peptide chain release factor 3
VLAQDRTGAPVFLARNAWELGRMQKEWPAIRFLSTRERV